ncbi:MAG: hypothetical protein AB8B78_12170 [Polaribacter sp.]
MKFIKYFIILFVCISCNNKNSQIEHNKYQILNLIYSDFSKQQMEFFVFPAKPLHIPDDFNYPKLLSNKNYMDSLHNTLYSNKISKKDSLIIIQKYIENKKNQQIFAFDLKMQKYHNYESKNIETNIIGFKELYKKFIKSNEKNYINLNKILSKNNDSLIVFNDKFLKKQSGVDYKNFNVLLSFSDITFNTDFTKAILAGTRSFSKTDTHSSIFFFKKKNGGNWKIIFEEFI